MASSGRWDLHHGHDVHKTQYRRISPTHRLSKGVHLDPQDQSGHCLHMEHRHILLEPLPVRPCREAVGLADRSRGLRETRSFGFSGICSQRHGHRVRLPLRESWVLRM